MIRLDLPREPYRLDLGACVAVTVRPLDTAVMAAARISVDRTLRDLRADQARLRELAADPSTLPDLEDPDTRAGLAEAFLVKALARHAIIGWEGVLTADGSSPAPITEQTVGDLMSFWHIAASFLNQYTAPFVRLEQEKNG